MTGGRLFVGMAIVCMMLIHQFGLDDQLWQHLDLSVLSVLAIALATVLAMCILFLPTIIATRRRHRNRVAIFVCNIFFWPVALIWSFTNNCEA
jgi:Superinfection immunity protein